MDNQNAAHETIGTSGSMFSNSASTTRSIRRFSLWRCFSPPANTIHGFCWLLAPGDLLRQCLLDELLERASLSRSSGFCFAEERLGNFEGSFHK